MTVHRPQGSASSNTAAPATAATGQAQAGAHGAAPMKGGPVAGRSFAQVMRAHADESEGGGRPEGRGPARRKLATEVDEESLAAFRAPPCVLLAPPLLSRPTAPASGAVVAARAIAERIVEAARVETGRPGRVDFVLQTRDDVLGGLEVRVRVEHGIVHASFTSGQPEVRAALEGQFNTLRDALTHRGLAVGELQVADGRAHDREREQREHRDGRHRREDAWAAVEEGGRR